MSLCLMFWFCIILFAWQKCTQMHWWIHEKCIYFLFIDWFQIPGVPVIFGLRNALLLEPPSVSQRQFVKSSEEERLHMTELEHKLLSKRPKNRLTSKEMKDSSDENEALEDQNLGLQAATNENNAKRRMVVKDRVQFKRNKAKVIIHDRLSYSELWSWLFASSFDYYSLFPVLFLHSRVLPFVNVIFLHGIMFILLDLVYY